MNTRPNPSLQSAVQSVCQRLSLTAFSHKQQSQHRTYLLALGLTASVLTPQIALGQAACSGVAGAPQAGINCSNFINLNNFLDSQGPNQATITNQNGGTISSAVVTTINIGADGDLTLNNVAGGTISHGGANTVINVGAPTVGGRGVVNITNSGTIINNGTGRAIVIPNGVIGPGAVTVTNNGSILSSGTGSTIEIGRTNTITNNGTIRNVNNSANAFAIVSGGTGSSITNNGTITATASGNEGAGTIRLDAGSHTLVNRGTISNTNGGNAIMLNATTATIDNYGVISSTGGNSIRLFGSTLTLNVYDGSSFVGAVNFDNRNGNTINFFTGSYTLPVEKFILATNNINLRGTGNQLITSGLNAQGTGNIVVVAPQVATTTPNTVQNTVTSVSTVVSSITNNISTNLQGTTPEVTPIDGLGTEFTSSLDTNADRQAQRLKDRFLDNSFASLDTTAVATPLAIKQGHAFDKYGNLVWARAFASNRDMARNSVTAGSDNHIVGALVGYDRTLDDWRLGAYAGYGNGRTSMNDNSGRMSTDLYMAGLYARHAFSEYVLLANLATGLMENRSHRYINLGAERATGTFTSYFIAPELAVSRSFALNDTWSLTPTIRGRYIAAFMPRYSESGSSQNVRYSADTTQMLEERIEFKLAKGFMRPANNEQQEMLYSSLYGQVAGIATQRLTSGKLNANLLNTEFTVYDPHARDTLGTLVGVGFDHQFSPTLIGFGGYDATYFNDSSTIHTARLGLKMAF